MGDRKTKGGKYWLYIEHKACMYDYIDDSILDIITRCKSEFKDRHFTANTDYIALYERVGKKWEQIGVKAGRDDSFIFLG